MKRRLYVAYGSNLNVEQMRRRCPGAVPLRAGWLKGYRLVFRGSSPQSFGVASVEPDPGGRVPVAIYSITLADEQALDVYEGFPRVYVKERIKGLGFLYIMRPGYSPARPSRQYLWAIVQGYRDWGLPLEYLEQAVARCREEVEACGKATAAEA